MAERTIQEVLGTSATQSSSQVTIAKSDLTGLTASENNTAESILVGVLLKAQAVLTPTNKATNPDQSITIVTGTPTLTTEFDTVTGNSTVYKETPMTITLRKL